MLIKIFFELDCFFKLQKVVKSQIHFNYKLEGADIQGAGALTGVLFCLQVDRPVNGGAYNIIGSLQYWVGSHSDVTDL